MNPGTGARHGKQNGTRAMLEVLGLGREFGYDALWTAYPIIGLPLAQTPLNLTVPVDVLVDVR
jgi:hypothetical protein